LASQNLEYQAELVSRAKVVAMAEFAQQVAHDIRSPLAALDVVAGNVSQLPEDKRILIRSAVGRIRDIANSLLDKQRTLATATSETKDADGDASRSGQEATSSQLLSSLIESLVTEKRLQFRSRSRVEIEAWLDAPSYGIFSKVQPVEFKRLLSNLINNAVEAFGDGPGAVRINLSAQNDRAIVKVKDNGKGIPPEILAKLGQRGETHGKTGGSGLGLYHARVSAESWNGKLAISSEAGNGTTITVDLPQAPTPDWFVSGLTLTKNKIILILDDDASIHQIWQGRLDSIRARENGIEVVHVSTPGEIRSWVKDNEGKVHEALYLLDYELLGSRETGLSLASELGIGERAILVTSRYEEPGILESCRKLKTRMIPKGLAGLVPIRIEDIAPEADPARRRWDAILIDDDPLARMTWKMAAEKAGKSFRAFSTAADFLNESDAIDRGTPVYVDAELGNGVKGDAESLRIRELGFGQIYLATGHAPEKFAGLAYLRGVVGKEPPWNQEA
jgi:anti-sigma regulatory factor (Ser/Thr protein kinase)